MNEETLQLIQRYADGIITNDEMQELNALLASDPEAAKLFCEQLQMDQLISSHYHTLQTETAIREQLAETSRAVEYTYHRPPRPSPWQTLHDHLWGPIGSLAFHILIIFALAGLVFVRFQHPRTSEVEVTILEPEAADLEAFSEVLEEISPVEMPPWPSTKDQPPPGVKIASYLPTYTDTDYAALEITEPVTSPLLLHGLYKGRHWQGPTLWTTNHEVAILRSLDWLQANQQTNGCWLAGTIDHPLPEYNLGVTSLGLLAFLAHGETPASRRYGDTTVAAIRYILSQQNDDGSFGVGKHRAYTHTLATLALAETYSLTRIPLLRTALEKATGHFTEQPPGHTDVLPALQILALRSLHLANLSTQSVSQALANRADALRNPFHPGQLPVYAKDPQPSTNQPPPNPFVVHALQLSGHAYDDATQDAIQTLSEHAQNKTLPNSDWPQLRRHCLTQIFFHTGGQTWADWYLKKVKPVTEQQQTNGSWQSPKKPSPNKTLSEAHLGPAYHTAINTLTLETYYRFLHLYKSIATEPPPQKNTNDITIQLSP